MKNCGRKIVLKQKKAETVCSLLEHYYEQKYKNNLISERSYKIYQNIIFIIKRNLPNIPIQQLATSDIENLNEHIRSFSNETISKIWSALKLAFKIAYNRQFIAYNIMEDEMILKPRSNKPKKNIEALTISQQKRLIRVFNYEIDNYPKHLDFIYACLLCLYTGMRIGEVLALCVDSIDFKKNTITVKRTLSTNQNGKIYLRNHTKSYRMTENIDKGKRTFYMSPNVKKIIQEMFNRKTSNPYNLIFWNSKKNNFLISSNINNYLQRLNKKYNIISTTLHTHILRHTFITRCIESGINLKVVQYLVGHVKSSSLTLDIYTSVSSDFVKKEIKKNSLFL